MLYRLNFFNWLKLQKQIATSVRGKILFVDIIYRYDALTKQTETRFIVIANLPHPRNRIH